jgi:hypothetical protein
MYSNFFKPKVYTNVKRQVPNCSNDTMIIRVIIILEYFLSKASVIYSMMLTFGQTMACQVEVS